MLKCNAVYVVSPSVFRPEFPLYLSPLLCRSNWPDPQQKTERVQSGLQTQHHITLMTIQHTQRINTLTHVNLAQIILSVFIF
jgi:hypothetical protein